MSAPKEPAGPATGGRPIFVIASDNTGVHVYQDAQSVVAAKEAGPGPLGSIDFFDTDGRRLSPVLSGTGALRGLRDAGGRPDEPTVAKRLGAVVQHLATTVDERLAGTVNPRVTREQALAKLPDLDGRSLPDCYVVLEPIFGHAAGRFVLLDDGSWWHNFWCH